MVPRIDRALVWVACPASLKHSGPPRTKTEAEETIAAQKSLTIISGKTGTPPGAIAESAALSPKDLRNVEWALEQIDSQASGGWAWGVELGDVFNTGCGVKVDAYSLHENELRIAYFRFGHSQPPNPFWLFRLQSAALVKALGLQRFRSLRLVQSLIQPNYYPERVWTRSDTINPTLRWDLSVEDVKGSISRNYYNGGSHCVFCDLKSGCRTFLNGVGRITRTLFETYDGGRTPRGYKPELYRLVLEQKQRIDYLKTELETLLIQSAEKGDNVAPFTLVYGRGRRKIDAPISELEHCEKLTGKTLVKKQPLTISEYESLPKVVQNLLARYVKHSVGAKKLELRQKDDN